MKKILGLISLSILLGAVPATTLAQNFVTPPTPTCPANASPMCALQAQAITRCSSNRSPDEFNACMNAAVSSANAMELDKVKSANKALREKEDAENLGLSKTAPSYSPPASVVCPKSGVPGLIECDLAKRAFAACNAAKTPGDFSACVRSYSSTKPLTCTLAATTAESDNCKRSNKSRG